jgi:glycosyltransferase involved in cell wall biosynthesis
MLTEKNNRPLITVVTVVYNGKHKVEQTIQNVLNQTYPHIEYIVLDGGSTDGTQDIIRKYTQEINLWISEPDRGIYDAMNKGIALARGEWINFINAGDSFAHNNTLAEIMEAAPREADVLFGDALEHFKSGRTRVCSSGDIKDLWKGMICSHQAMLMRSTLLKMRPFNTEFSIAADYDLLSELCHEQKVFQRLPMLIVHTHADGYSDLRNVELTRQQWQIAKKFWGPLYSGKLDSYYFLLLLSIMMKNLLKKILPKPMLDYLRSNT